MTDLLVISPHYDDAALSCGGMIHAFAERGARVRVVTVCGGPPPVYAGGLSDFAESLHRRWARSASVDADAAPGSPAVAPELAVATAMTAVRRREEDAALARLGAEGIVLEVPDAIYRIDAETGRWRIAAEAELFAGGPGQEPALVASVALQLAEMASPATLLVAPLALGNHVDHWLCRSAGQTAASRYEALAYYEDYPYAETVSVAGALGTASGVRGVEITLEDADLEAKLEAIAAYRSQINTFWGSLDEMRTAVTAFTRSGEGWAERLWLVAP